MIFNTLQGGEARMNQRGAEYPAWICICKGAEAKSYVEVGCGVGRGVLRFREAYMPKVVGIDLCPHPPSIFEQERPEDKNLYYIAADSSSDEAIQRTIEFLGGDPDAIFIDADHGYEKSKKDFEKWWPHAKLLLGFHDILMNPADNTVAKLWNEIKFHYRSLELYSRDLRSALEWQGQGCLDASPDGRISGGGIGILFKE